MKLACIDRDVGLCLGTSIHDDYFPPLLHHTVLRMSFRCDEKRRKKYPFSKKIFVPRDILKHLYLVISISFRRMLVVEIETDTRATILVPDSGRWR